jgi:hypothetical protein
MMHEIETYDVGLSDIRKACKESVDYLAATAAPHIYRYAFPSYYRAIFHILKEALTTERDFSKFALGFPRGFAKSTFLMFVVLWAIQYTRKSNIVIVCANVEPLGKAFMANLISLLDHENICAIFGNWRVSALKTTQTDLEFRLDGRLIKVTVAGQGASLRGLVRDGSRPDFIILDDIQTKDDAKSEAVSDGILDWLYSTVNFLRSPFGCTYVFLANMYPTPHAILKKLAEDPEWQTFIASAITSDGESLWEELHPLEQLLKDYNSLKSQGKEGIFWAELMNLGDLNTQLDFDPGKLKKFTGFELEYHQGAFIVIDPSGRKKRSDNTVISGFKVIDGIPVCVLAVDEILTPKQTIFKAIEMATILGASLLVAEDVAYQETLIFWFEEYLTAGKLSGLNIVGINPGGVSKNSRLINVIKSSQVGEIGFTEETAPIFAEEATGFNPLTVKNKDNFMDTCEYAQKVVQQFGHMIALESPTGDSAIEIPLVPEHLTDPLA